MKIAIVVQGRLHAFDLAKALRRSGHDVTVFTNYPHYVCRRFGMDGIRIRSFPLHGVFERVVAKLHQHLAFPNLEAFRHRLFGQWSAHGLRKESWDFIHCFSGVSEEILQDSRIQKRATLLMRGSSHIEEQADLLHEEAARTHEPIEVPSEWIIQRELREYRLSDHIITLSTFAQKSFLSRGLGPQQTHCIPLGVDVNDFRASREIVEVRSRRIMAGEPLGILYVGTLSLRKGLWDLIQIARQLQGKPIEISCVGPVPPESMELLRKAGSNVRVVGKIPQRDLPKWYAAADLFVFPTIEDGFAVVLTQALANSVPVLTTTNSAGPDLIVDGRHGFVLPIRKPEAFVEKIKWALEHRKEVAEMVRYLHDEYQPRTWDHVAQDFDSFVRTVA